MYLLSIEIHLTGKFHKSSCLFCIKKSLPLNGRLLILFILSLERTDFTRVYLHVKSLQRLHVDVTAYDSELRSSVSLVFIL